MLILGPKCTESEPVLLIQCKSEIILYDILGFKNIQQTLRVPQAASRLGQVFLSLIYRYSYGEPIPYRFSNEAYLAKLVVPLRSVADHIRNMSYYSEPAKKFTGRGHLACVHYTGNKAFSNRRPLYKELSIRDDVNLLSFYAKNRLAAAGLAVESATGTSPPSQR
ncbi:hypothetical protein HF086_017346 [Spodoptera exigua]|uniref:Uncharacterized protein n=1 Tax=Spodoptera exigua TaxID=7107 RepID=A0A922M0Y7_SPOEX|nr:hypothetical protein HF086_017346 [Spodoptera exigua]